MVDEGDLDHRKDVPEVEEEEISSIYLLEVASLEPVQEVVTGNDIEITAAPSSGAPFWWASSSRCSRSSVGRCSSSVGPSRRPTNGFGGKRRWEMMRALNKQKSRVLQKLGFQPNDSFFLEFFVTKFGDVRAFGDAD